MHDDIDSLARNSRHIREPEICHRCGCKNLIVKNRYYEGEFLSEYTLFCESNNHHVRTWAYGHWQDMEPEEDEINE